MSSLSQRQEGKNRKLGANPKTFTEAEERRITRAIEENESIGKVAKEMGRTYRSVLAKMWRRKQAMTTVAKGRFSAEEDSRTRLAVENGEDYRKVAIELGRDVTSVRTRMNRLRIYSESNRKQREFTAEEDFLILDKIIPRLKFKKLSTSGFLLTSDLMELATESHRNHGSVRERWEGTLQPWLLQNFTSTSGFRVDVMLANLVMEKLGKDRMVIARRELDWGELVEQNKEFAGHTNRSLRRVYDGIINRAEKKNSSTRATMTLKDVADYAIEFSSIARRKEKASREERRELIVSYLKSKMMEHKIKV